jgi:hypothetical protein
MYVHQLTDEYIGFLYKAHFGCLPGGELPEQTQKAEIFSNTI